MMPRRRQEPVLRSVWPRRSSSPVGRWSGLPISPFRPMTATSSPSARSRARTVSCCFSSPAGVRRVQARLEAIKVFAEQADGKNVKVVGVSLQEDASTIKTFVDKKEIGYSIVLDPEMTAAKSFGVEGIPTLVGIAINGEVVFRGHAMPEDPTELTKKLTDAS